jgi:hypothetical protein
MKIERPLLEMVAVAPVGVHVAKRDVGLAKEFEVLQDELYHDLL